MNKTFTPKNHTSHPKEVNKHKINFQDKLYEMDHENCYTLNKLKTINFDVRQGVVDKILDFAKRY